MRNITRSSCLVVAAIIALAAAAQAQSTTLTGTAVIYGSGFNTRTLTRSFTMTVKGQTSQADALRYLTILQDAGQDGLRDAIKNQDLGTFALTGQVGRSLNAVLIDNVDGKKRIRAVFERWIGFGELRGGYRSVDYPFSYVEILIDPASGKGEGTFIPAARIRFKTGGSVEIEDFGTFPGRLMGVTLRGRQL